MSRFQVGDKVRCLNGKGTFKLIEGEQYTVTAIGGRDVDSVCVNGRNDDWWYAIRFEPVPAESPDDWVEITDPNHIPRAGIDWWGFGGDRWMIQNDYHNKLPVGEFKNIKHRCRRKDLPVKPESVTPVSSGGMYVDRSEYERVCAEAKEATDLFIATEKQLCEMRGERDGLKKQVDTITEEHSKLCVMLNAQAAGQKLRGEEIAKLRQEVVNLRKQLEDSQRNVEILQRELNNEIISNGQVIQVLRDTIEELNRQLFHADQYREETFQRWTACKEALKLAEIAKRAVTMERDVAESRLELEAVNNPNNWPLVPVDPKCIPEGHRAVEVTCKMKGKLGSVHGRAAPWDDDSCYALLVVEPVPAEQPSPDPLPVPEPPAWLRQGWWYWCGSDGYWCIGENQPVWDGTRWSPKGGHTGIHTSDMCHPIDKSRASEACWQVK